MSENRESSERQVEVPSGTVKLDQVRNISAGALLRTIPSGQQARYMMATPVQSQGAVISSSATIQTQVIPKTTVGSSSTSNQASVSRLSTVPVQAATTASYHVPRGAAAVANIAVPRSSVATPIVRAPSNLQTIGVTQQHTITGSVGGSGSIVRPVLGVTPWMGVTTCLPSGQSQTTTTRQSVQQIRPPPITVGARMAVSSQMRPVGESQAQGGSQGTTLRPVLLHTTTTHKQVTLTQQTQVQVTDKTVLKGYSGATARIGVVPSPTPPLSRITTSIPPMVSLRPAVLVPSGQPMVPIKGNPTQAKVLTQPTHGPMLSSVPVSSVQQSAIAISTVVTRPVMISGSSVAGMSVTAGSAPAMVRSSTPKVFHPTSTEQSNPVYIHTQTHKTQQGSTVTSVVSLANTMYSLPTATYYEGGFQMGVARPSKTTQAQPTQVQGSTTTTQPLRFNPVMVVDSSRSQVHPSVPSSESTNTTEANTTTPVGALSLSTMTSGIAQNLTPKQNTSPRPSILRKRDPEGSPLKAQKNLNPVLSGLTVATPSSPPSPPKRPESGNSGQSSGGSTTISATSSPGQGDPESPPLKQDSNSHEVASHQQPPEMSPRKKPRKQQLTGNQMNEPTFSEDEMEFITEDKLKKEIKEEPMEEPEKVLPRRTMSLLNSYKRNWKSRNNHFIRYTDVKVKEEKKPTLSEIANQKQALQKLSGWKIFHLGSQIEGVVNSESEYFETYTSLLAFLEQKQRKTKNKDLDREINRVNERIKANFQRSKVVKDQMLEAKCQVLKLFDHKGYVTDIITRSASKRSMKKRERV